MRIARVEAGRTLPLRQRILRPHQTMEELAIAGDDDPDTGYFAAIADGEVIGTASVRRQLAPWSKDAPAWRLGGMATAEAWRNRGIGAAVLAAVVEHVRDHGGGLVWCNARVPAVAFYQRGGFVTRGGAWDEPLIGPHIAMETMVDSR